MARLDFSRRVLSCAYGFALLVGCRPFALLRINRDALLFVQGKPAVLTDVAL